MEALNSCILNLADCELIRFEAFCQLKYIASRYELDNFEGWYWSTFTNPNNYEYEDKTAEYVLPYTICPELLKHHSKWDDTMVNQFISESQNIINQAIVRIENLKKLTLKQEPLKYTFTAIQETRSEADISLKYKEKHLFITKDVYNNLKNSINYKCFNNNTEDLLIWCLAFRHKYLGIYNRSSQLSVHPSFIKFLEDNFDLEAELFGSAFNHTTRMYGSLFLDIECYFNSIGNFFDMNITEGIYEINPPFVTSVITKTVDILLEMLQSKKSVEFIVVLPVWDYKGQHLLKKKCKNYRYEPGEFEEMKCFEKMNKSEFLKEHFIVCDEVMKYYDYFSNRTINHVSPTHIYYLSNTYVSYQKKNMLRKFFSKTFKNEGDVICKA